MPVVLLLSSPISLQWRWSSRSAGSAQSFRAAGEVDLAATLLEFLAPSAPSASTCHSRSPSFSSRSPNRHLCHSRRRRRNSSSRCSQLRRSPLRGVGQAPELGDGDAAAGRHAGLQPRHQDAFPAPRTYSESRGHNFALNASFDEISVNGYDGLVPLRLGMDEKVLDLVRKFPEAKKPIASVCHGRFGMGMFYLCGAEQLQLKPVQATAASAAAADDGAGQDHDQLPSGGWAPVVDDEGSSEQVGASGELEEQPSELGIDRLAPSHVSWAHFFRACLMGSWQGILASLRAGVGHGTGPLGNQPEQQEERWSKYSRKVLVFAISMFATYYLGSASTTSFSTGDMAFKIAIGAFFIADATLSILMPPKWSTALVYLSWLLLEIVSYLLLISFNKYYAYAILPMPLPIVVAFLQLKLKPRVMQQRRAHQNVDVENAEQDHDTNGEDSQHFDRIFELSGDIVNCGGIITVIFGNSIVGPASALGFLFFYTIALGLYLMMITTVRTVALIPHARHLANLLKVLLVITLITALIHGVGR